MQIFYFQKAYRLPALILAVILLLPACKKEDVQPYLPQANDQAIIFTHKFQPGDYEAGKSIVIERFSHDIETSGQIRRTYFLEDPAVKDMMAASFFHPESGTEAWLNEEERAQVLASLQPFYREPLQVRIYTVDKVHDTH